MNGQLDVSFQLDFWIFDPQCSSLEMQVLWAKKLTKLFFWSGTLKVRLLEMWRDLLFIQQLDPFTSKKVLSCKSYLEYDTLMCSFTFHKHFHGPCVTRVLEKCCQLFIGYPLGSIPSLQKNLTKKTARILIHPVLESSSKPHLVTWKFKHFNCTKFCVQFLESSFSFSVCISSLVELHNLTTEWKKGDV